MFCADNMCARNMYFVRFTYFHAHDSRVLTYMTLPADAHAATGPLYRPPAPAPSTSPSTPSLSRRTLRPRKKNRYIVPFGFFSLTILICEINFPKLRARSPMLNSTKNSFQNYRAPAGGPLVSIWKRAPRRAPVGLLIKDPL